MAPDWAKATLITGSVFGFLELVQVGRAGDHTLRLVAAVIHVDQHQPVGVRVRMHGHDLADRDGLGIPPGADHFDAGNFKPGQRQPFGQVCG